MGDAKLKYLSETVELTGVGQYPDVIVGYGDHKQVDQIIGGLSPLNLETDLRTTEGVDPAGKIGPRNQDGFVFATTMETNWYGITGQYDLLWYISSRVKADDLMSFRF